MPGHTMVTWLWAWPFTARLVAGTWLAVAGARLWGCASAARQAVRVGLKGLLAAGPAGQASVPAGTGQASLLEAVGQGSVHLVSQLLAQAQDHDADVNATNEQHQTPLLIAAKQGHAQIARLLLAHSAAVDMRDDEMRTPLMRAAEGGHTEVGRLLVEAGASVHAASTVGRTSLIYATMTGDAVLAELLLQHGADVNATDQRGCTPLIMAVQLPGRSQLVALLVAAGAAVDAVDFAGCSALYYAAGRGDSKSAQQLLAAGANATLANSFGQAPLHFASQVGSAAVVQLLLQHGAGSQINAREVSGDAAPLNFAVACGSSAVVGLLLQAGADPDLPNHDGQTPLHQASLHGAADIVQQLLAARGPAAPPLWQPRQQEALVCSPLHYAAEYGREEAAAVLLAAQPELAGMPDQQGLLPVHLALEGAHYKLARILLARGDYFTLPGGSSQAGPQELLLLLDAVGDSSVPLYAELVRRFAFSPYEWQMVPTPCPALAPALPAVLARSAAEAAQLVAHLPGADRCRLQTALLSLHRVQRECGVDLPVAVLPSLLSRLFAA